MPPKRWQWNDDQDRFLAKHYDPSIRGRSEQIARCLGVPRWAVNRRAAALGLSRVKDRPWSRKDEEYLEAHLHRTALRTIARRLGRSPTAVKLKAKRLGLRKHGEGYTAYSLAQALGVDPHWVLERIRAGKLRASHRRTERTEAQHGDSWLITEEAVVAFIKRNPYDLDLRKADPLWFLDLVSAWLQDPANARRTPQRARDHEDEDGDWGGGRVNKETAA